MPASKFTFKKAERLKSRKIIGQLFSAGKSKSFYPLRFVWLATPLPSPYPVQFTVSVSTRHFSNAVDRNRIKRQIRETYRLQKHILYPALNAQNKQLALMVIFIAKKPESYTLIEKKMTKAIQYFIEKEGGVLPVVENLPSET